MYNQHYQILFFLQEKQNAQLFSLLTLPNSLPKSTQFSQSSSQWNSLMLDCITLPMLKIDKGSCGWKTGNGNITWSTRYCRLGQEVPCWFQWLNNSAGFFRLVQELWYYWYEYRWICSWEKDLRSWSWLSLLNWIGALIYLHF